MSLRQKLDPYATQEWRIPNFRVKSGVQNKNYTNFFVFLPKFKILFTGRLYFESLDNGQIPDVLR